MARARLLFADGEQMSVEESVEEVEQKLLAGRSHISVTIRRDVSPNVYERVKTIIRSETIDQVGVHVG